MATKFYETDGKAKGLLLKCIFVLHSRVHYPSFVPMPPTPAAYTRLIPNLDSLRLILLIEVDIH